MIRIEKLKEPRFLQIPLAVLFIILLLKLVIEFSILATPITNHIGQIYTDTTYNNLIEVKGKASSFVINYTELKITNVPSGIVESFLLAGGKVFITDTDLDSLLSVKTEGKTESKTAGFFKHGKAGIGIWLSTDLMKTYDGTAEHEFGHFVDWKYGWLSEQLPFAMIAEHEKTAFKENINSSEYYQSDKEYFAECFSMFCTNPTLLKTHCPMTYEIIKNAIDDTNSKMEN